MARNEWDLEVFFFAVHLFRALLQNAPASKHEPIYYRVSKHKDLKREGNNTMTSSIKRS
jgi:hypothetical protein